MLSIKLSEPVMPQEYFFLGIGGLIVVLLIVGVFFVIKMYRNAKRQREELHKIVKSYEEIIRSRENKK